MSSIALPSEESHSTLRAPTNPDRGLVTSVTEFPSDHPNQNRLNAQKSTGPTSPQGKRRVSQNATKHGLSSTRIPSPCPIAT